MAHLTLSIKKLRSPAAVREAALAFGFQGSIEVGEKVPLIPEAHMNLICAPKDTPGAIIAIVGLGLVKDHPTDRRIQHMCALLHAWGTAWACGGALGARYQIHPASSCREDHQVWRNFGFKQKHFRPGVSMWRYEVLVVPQGYVWHEDYISRRGVSLEEKVRGLSKEFSGPELLSYEADVLTYSLGAFARARREARAAAMAGSS